HGDEGVLRRGGADGEEQEQDDQASHGRGRMEERMRGGGERGASSFLPRLLSSPLTPLAAPRGGGGRGRGRRGRGGSRGSGRGRRCRRPARRGRRGGRARGSRR